LSARQQYTSRPLYIFTVEPAPYLPMATYGTIE